MNTQEIISKFLGYEYHEKVLVDFSDCGGLYDWTDIYSKVPIEIDNYSEDEKYLKDGWTYLNSQNYIINPDYLQYNELMPVIEKIGLHSACIVEINYALVCTCRICYLGKNKYDKAISFYGDNNGGKEPIMAIYKCVVKFLKYLENEK